MARKAQPIELAKLKGSDRKNPQRYRKEVPKHPLAIGVAPDCMSEAAKACWFEIAGLAIPGTLTAADRFMLELAANLLAEYRTTPAGFTAARLGRLFQALACFGMSPVDRVRLGVPREPAPANPFDALDP